MAHSKQDIFFFLQKYVPDFLKETCKPINEPTSTPIDPNLRLKITEEDITIDKGMYQCLIRKFIYLSILYMTKYSK